MQERASSTGKGEWEGGGAASSDLLDLPGGVDHPTLQLHESLHDAARQSKRELEDHHHYRERDGNH